MKKIMKRFLILFLCFSLLSGIYTKKANAVAVVDDIIIVGGVAVTAAAFSYLCKTYISQHGIVFNNGDIRENIVDDSIVNPAVKTSAYVSYLVVKSDITGKNFLTFTQDGINWIKDSIKDLLLKDSYHVSESSLSSVTVRSSSPISKHYDCSLLGEYSSIYVYRNDVEFFGFLKNDNLTYGLEYTPNKKINIYRGDSVAFSEPLYYDPTIYSFKVKDIDISLSNAFKDYSFANPQKPNEDPNGNEEKPKVAIPLGDPTTTGDPNKEIPPDFEINPSVDTGSENNPYVSEESYPYEKPYEDYKSKVEPNLDPNPTPDPDPNPTPDPDPNPTPDPDPNPDTGTDEDKLPDNDTPVLDFSPLYGATRKFPFCLPWDIYECIKVFKSEEEPLKYEFKETKYSDTEIIIIPNFEIDFSKIPHINILRNVLKLFLYYQFIRFLMISIRKVMWS